MEKTNEMKINEAIDIKDLSYALFCVEALKKISRSLNKLAVYECNYGDLTPRQALYQAKILIKANELASYIGYKIYYQGDPRGCSLYLLDETMNERNYNNGIALC